MPPALAWIFPGQNSRYPSMLEKLVARDRESVQWIERASDVLGRDLARHYRSDNDGIFARNRDVQIGVFLANHLHWQSLERAGLRAGCSAGLSLGEYNHLVHIGALDEACAPLPRTLGGWLKMGMVGTTPAARNVLLVGDAAGLVNPLQGEGIAQALLSGHAAASCVLATPGTAATAYLDWIRTSYGSWFSATAPIHARLVQHPRVIARVSSAITAPVVGPLVASTWALYWNDLARGAAPSLAATAARALHAVARTATSPSRVCRQLRNDLAPQTPSWSAASETSAF